MQDTLQIEEFLRFRRENPHWMDKLKEQRNDLNQEEKEIAKLTHRNTNKHKEL